MACGRVVVFREVVVKSVLWCGCVCCGVGVWVCISCGQVNSFEVIAH